MSNKSRTFAILGLAVVILGAATALFRFETQRKPTPLSSASCTRRRSA